MPTISRWQEKRDTDALTEFMRAEGQRIRAQLRRARQPWRERLTEQELQLVQFAQIYTQHFGDRLAEWPDGRRVALMAKLASLLDEKELVVVTYGDGPE